MGRRVDAGVGLTSNVKDKQACRGYESSEGRLDHGVKPGEKWRWHRMKCDYTNGAAETRDEKSQSEINYEFNSKVLRIPLSRKSDLSSLVTFYNFLKNINVVQSRGRNCRYFIFDCNSCVTRSSFMLNCFCVWHNGFTVLRASLIISTIWIILNNLNAFQRSWIYFYPMPRYATSICLCGSSYYINSYLQEDTAVFVRREVSSAIKYDR